MSLNFLSNRPTNQEIHERSDEQHEAIKRFLAENDMTFCQPCTAKSNEASRATKELVAKRRREFRRKQKEMNK